MILFCLWLGLAGLVSPACATEVRVQALRLLPDAAWQRATPEQEAADDAIGLSWPVAGGVGVQVLVPRSAARVGLEAARFQRNFERLCRHRHGRAAAAGWLRPAARDWLVCRRPAAGGDGVLFHLVTLHAGHAYSVLVLAPAGTQVLPKVAHELLAGSEFVAPDTPMHAAAPLPARAPQWRLAHTWVLAPRGEALAALARAEGEALGETGLLTTYTVQPRAAEASAPALGWSLDGLRWAAGGDRDRRAAFASRGHLAASAPAEWPGELRVRFEVQAAEHAVALHVSSGAYCGPPAAWQEAVAALEQGAGARFMRLAASHACAGPSPQGQWQARGGDSLSPVLALPATPPAAEARARWLALRVQASPGAVGEALLEQLGLVLVYLPQ